MQTHYSALTGLNVVLEPTVESHREALREVAQDPKIWGFTPSAQGKGFDTWFDFAMTEVGAGRQFPFTVRRIRDNKIVGTTRQYDFSEKHKHMTIGFTWYSPETWGTNVNPECKLLLLTDAFETRDFIRVEFTVDVRNERSRAAIKKLGAQEEGLLRQHMILEDGYVRDTVVYSIIKSEWPSVKNKLNTRLQRSGV
jgi:RimJ/RimL family protein N-acetyltransferase